MARDVTVEVRHAVYGTWDHKRGADLSVPPGPLTDLLRTADHALDRRAGGFFETIEDRLVLGFEDERREGTKGQMGYFDVFTLPAGDAEDLSVADLVAELRSSRVDSYREEPTPERAIEVPLSRSVGDDRRADPVDRERNERRNDAPDSSATSHHAETDRSADRGNRGDGSGSDDHDHDHEHGWDAEGEPLDQGERSSGPGESNREPELNATDAAEPAGDDETAGVGGGIDASDERFVAQMWEQIRRDSFQCRAHLDDVDRFVGAVDGALREISVVTDDRVETDHFDVVTSDGLEYAAEDTGTLERTVRELADDGDLTYGALPTYREELRSLRERKRRSVRDDAELLEALERSTDGFRRDLAGQFGQVSDRAASLMETAERGSLDAQDDDDDARFASRLKGIVGGDADDGSKLLRPEEYAELDPEAVARIDSELRQERERVRETLEEELLPELEDDLLELLETRVARTAQEAAEGLEETRRSDVYERADLETDGSR